VAAQQRRPTAGNKNPRTEIRGKARCLCRKKLEKRPLLVNSARTAKLARTAEARKIHPISVGNLTGQN
jgi:hypothetical protein